MCVVVAPIEIQCKEANFPRLVPVLRPLAITFPDLGPAQVYVYYGSFSGER